MKSPKLAVLIAVPLLAVSLVGCCACPCSSVGSRATPASTPVIVSEAGQPTALPSQILVNADSEEALLINIYQRVNPAVVNIQVARRMDISEMLRPEGPGPSPEPEDFYEQGSGSGFLVDREGHIVTNNHVVEGAEEVRVTFHEGTTVRAEIVGTDPDSDLAVIRVELAAELAKILPVELGDSDTLQVGQRAIALGNPYGLRGTLTTGIISALGRSLPLGRLTESVGSRFTIPELIQTDAAINPGNSGGPLLDSQGKVIGVNTAYDPDVSGVGFAVPVNTARRVVPRLIRDGRYTYPWLGVSGTDLALEHVEEMDLPVERGAIVLSVSPGSPAEKAGLQGSQETLQKFGREIAIGGDVIIAIDDQKVEQFEDLLVYILRETEVSQSVRLRLIRDGREREVVITLAERPER